MTSPGRHRTPAGDLPPTWLRQPPSDYSLDPPSVTQPEVLPIGHLPWADVERLFLRLAEVELGQVQYASLYGVPGQSQEGIDLYIRHTPIGDRDLTENMQRRYSTLQSKRVKRLTAGEIESAATKYLDGKWASVTRCFVYATTHSLKPTPLADQIVRQSERLESVGIELVPWGIERLSTMLRHRPLIVDEFFGREWTLRFCGQDAAEVLRSRLLPPQEVAQLRSKLDALYRSVFSTQDTGFALLSSRPSGRQFVMMDVAPEALSQTWPPAIEDQPMEDEAPALTMDPVGLVAEHHRAMYAGKRRARRRALRRGRLYSNVTWDDVPDGTRTPAVDWIATGDLSVISGPPGSGKSTLLRHVVLDLLGREPISQSLAHRFGGRIPVWIPFAFLCSHLAEGTDRSIPSAAAAWLTQQSHSDLIKLVDRALADDRLLLVVDGLDEWVDANAAGHAFGLLEAFVAGRPVASVMSSRPYALRRLPTLAGWRVGRLAPLSEHQRRELASIAFQVSHAEVEDAETISGLVERFLAELASLPDLQELAGVPLFLLLLAGVWSGEPMPTRRFTAYSRLVDLLLEKHPAIRRRTAVAPAAPVGEEDLRRVLAFVAYRLREEEPSLVLPLTALRAIIVSALVDPEILAYDAPTARALADRVLKVAEGDLGIVVKHGAGTIGFLHRVVVEQLAAEHLASLPLSAQRGVIRMRITDPAWRDVLLATVLLQRRPSDVSALIDAAVDFGSDGIEKAAGFEFAADALTAGARVNPQKAADLVRRLVDRVETHPWPAHRARLLTALTWALASPTMAALLRDRFKRWLPGRVPFPAAVFSVLAKPELTIANEHAVLAWGVRHHQKEVRVRAAIAAARRHGGSTALAEELGALVRMASNAEIQAAALMSLVEGWPGLTETHELVRWARKQAVPSLRLLALDAVYRTTQPEHQTLDGTYEPWTEAEGNWLLAQLDRERSSEPHWMGLDARLVAVAAAGNQAVRDACLQMLRGTGEFSDGNDTLAWSVVTTAFPNDEDVVDWFASRLEADRAIFRFLELEPEQNWLKDHPKIVAAVEARLAAGHQGLPQDRTTLASLAPSSKGVRNWLLASLNDKWAPWTAARALVESFGEDPLVREVLTAKLNGLPEAAAPLAYFAWDVLGLEAALTRLRAIVEANPEQAYIAAGALAQVWHKLELVANGREEPPDGLSQARAEAALSEHPADAIIDLCLAAVPDSEDQGHDEWLLIAWPSDPRIVDRARCSLRRKHPLIPAVLMGYAGNADAVSREIVAEATSRLSFLEPELRTVAAQQLGRPGLDPHLVIDLLRDWSMESDQVVRRAAATTLAQVVARQPEGVADPVVAEADRRLREQCREELSATGAEIDERRITGWIVMLTLGDLTLSDDLFNAYGGLPVDVELNPILRGPDPTFTALVAKHWSALNERFGPSLINRLDRDVGGTDGRSVWAALATVASTSPLVEADLLREVEQDPTLLEEDLVLAWYARSHPADQDVVKALFGMIAKHQGNFQPIAISLLNQLATEEQIKKGLAEWMAAREAERPQWARGLDLADQLGHWQRVLLAYCLPNDQRISELYADLKRHLAAPDQARDWLWTDASAIAFAAAPAAELPATFLQILATLQTRGPDFFGTELIDAVVNRLRRDPDAREHWTRAAAEPRKVDGHGLFPGREKLLDPEEPTASARTRQAILCSVLSSVTSLPAELASTLSQTLSRHDVAPLVWHDAIGEDRSSRLMLLDLLGDLA